MEGKALVERQLPNRRGRGFDLFSEDHGKRRSYTLEEVEPFSKRILQFGDRKALKDYMQTNWPDSEAARETL